MTLTFVRTDRDIHQAVLRELQWDSRVDETEVGVEVDRGVVTLTGTVSSYGKKIAAQEAAHRVAGVLDVANDIKVRVAGDPRTDTEIASAVRNLLEWDSFIPQDKISTTVMNGRVTLTGQVPFWADRQSAERVIRNLVGVAGITNNITVHAPEVAPETIRTTIEQALERRAEREARRIEVRVKDGTVALFGKVRDWEEKKAVLGSVSHGPGVRRVEDHLVIEIPGY